MIPSHPAITTLVLLASSLAIVQNGCSPQRSAERATRPEADIRSPQTLPRITEIPLQHAGDHLFLRATVNGEDAGLFLLDTGSAVNAVAPGVANRLRLPAYGSTSVAGIAGLERINYRQAESLAIGHVELDPSSLTGLRTYRLNHQVPMAGIIGFVGLKGVPFTIDYDAAALRIHSPMGFQPPPGATRTRLKTIGRLPAVQAELAPNLHADLIIDSGADAALTLPASMLRRYPQILTRAPTGQGSSLGVGGTTVNTLSWVKQLTIFGTTVHNVPVTFEQPSTPGARRTTVGRVGNRLLRRFNPTFDLSRGAIWTTWRPPEPAVAPSTSR